MSLHVLVVGRPTKNAGDIDPAAELAKSRDSFIVERCGPPAELLGRLRAIVLREYAKIDVLDIFDHAAHGEQKLSDEPLFVHYDEESFQLAREVAELLTPDARVRLLGCEVACEESGKALILGLQLAFGGSVVVYGALESTHGDEDFDECGFKRRSDEIKLCSSTELRAADAPLTARAHNAALTDFLAGVRAKVP